MTRYRSRRVVIDGEIRPAGFRCEGGRFVEIGSGPADHDFGDLLVLPGLVDSHVHVNEPGRTEWEGFETATRAAAAGGTTTIVDMPLNSIPPTVNVDALEQKRDAARGKLSVDTAFWGGLIPGSLPDAPALVEAGVCGFKAFMVDSGVVEFPPLGDGELREAMAGLAATGVPLLLHAESPALVHRLDGATTSYRDYLDSRPVDSETEAISIAAEMASTSGAAVHVLHISSGAGAEAVAAAPNLTGETCPHYLLFDAGNIPPGATAFKCAPPIRSREHREALWEALMRGDIDVVVSDHSPSPPDLKAIDTGDFGAAWGGISSLELRLSAVWTGCSERGVGIEHGVAWMSANPARLAGLDDRKGSIAVGKDADFVVFDPDAAFAVEGSALHHRHAMTPYEGMSMRGRVVAAVLRGQTVCSEGVVAGALRGSMLERYG